MRKDGAGARADRVDADIRRASTLPGAVYHSQAAYNLQLERIFARSWHFVTDTRRVRAPGRVVPSTLLPGSLNEPVVVTRDHEGRLHCLSNVCTHRGAIVAEGEGRANSLRCRYHGRRFGLDGSFRSMPEFEEAKNFPTERDNLPRLQTGRWGPFLFASIDPFCSFDEWIDPVRQRCGALPLNEARRDPDGAAEYLVDANWALYCDNYLEEFHIPYVHGASLSGLDYDGYRTECFRWSSLQLGVGRPGEPAFDLPEGHPDRGTRISAFYFWQFPNLMLNFYPWGISLNVVQPLGPGRTRVSFIAFVWDESQRHAGVGGDLHRVEMEDEEVVESQHLGLASRLYRRGRFSPRREVGAHHFHRLLEKMMRESA